MGKMSSFFFFHSILQVLNMKAFTGRVFNNCRIKPNWLFGLVYLQAGGNDDREEGLCVYFTVFRKLIHASLRMCVGVSELL